MIISRKGGTIRAAPKLYGLLPTRVIGLYYKSLNLPREIWGVRRNPGNGFLWYSFVQPPCYIFSFRQRQMELVDLGKSRPQL